VQIVETWNVHSWDDGRYFDFVFFLKILEAFVFFS